MFAYLVLIIVIIFPVFSIEPSGYCDMGIYQNDITVDLDIDRGMLNGLSHIKVRKGEGISFKKGRLKILDVRLNDRAIMIKESEGMVRLTPPDSGILEIRFRGVFKGGDGSMNVISRQGISLIEGWYPQIDGLSYHSLETILPVGYEAISEAEDIRRIEDGKRVTFYFDFPHPVDAINIVASNRYRVIKDRYNGVDVYAYFFEEDKGLVQRYIIYTKRYLQMYEELLGAFPYKRFSIVENILPTGYSMPTFTLLGSSIVKLPFIVETSLGHEVLHQWFGNMVYIDYDNGNWAEGLTTYLSDHLYEDREGRGWRYRKRLLMDYMSYVNEDNEFPLRGFYGGIDDVSRSIGYGKSSMVFHMLKNLMGEKAFLDCLRDFIKSYRFKKASWDDLKIMFKSGFKGDINWFFKQWIDEKGIPELDITDVELRYRGGGYELDFKLKQVGRVFRLDVPITIYSNGKGFKRFFSLSEGVKDFKIYLSEVPERIVLDEDYDIMRRLDEKEEPPVISRLIGGRNHLVILPIKEMDKYDTIIKFFKERGARLKATKEIKLSEIKNSTLIILGSDNPLIKELFGRLDVPDEGFSVIVKRNPWDGGMVVGILDGDSRDEIEAGFKKVTHYGAYSRLLFKEGMNINKEIEDSERGIIIDVSLEPSVIKAASLNTLSDIINDLKKRKIIYIGELHDVYAHHITQLEIIRRLYEENKRLAVGMEMFQRQFQAVLDEYIGGRIDEREFLKRSEYYKRWRFDFNLYKPILDFAVSRGIPVIALNTEEEIIDKVSDGGIDSLTDKERVLLPQEMDFSDSQYRERLMDVFKQHKERQRSNSGKERDFDYFYQSQIIWDETMAESIDRFLIKNPNYQIVVIAGQGHIEYGSGIPKRVYRRNGYDYAIVLIDAKGDRDIADYIIFPENIESPPTPRLMAYLQSDDDRVRITGFPEDSAARDAGLKEDDIIIALDDTPVSSIEDIRLHLSYKRIGDVLRVRVQRDVDGILKEIEFNVKMR
ncbi:MAG: hypothetical protein Fur0020_10440 [Thermodesulfovibrionia bacterium]